MFPNDEDFEGTFDRMGSTQLFFLNTLTDYGEEGTGRLTPKYIG